MEIILRKMTNKQARTNSRNNWELGRKGYRMH